MSKEGIKEVGLARYVWEWARRTSRAERLACLAALGVLVVCAALAGFLAAPRSPPPPPDVAQREWNVSREQWLAKPARGDHVPWPERFEPLRLVVVQHTVGPECFRLADCAATMRNLQLYYFKEFGYDVPYNFVVGNDGRVYEAHGWGEMGAHTRGYNPCALGLGFTGDYTPTGGARPTELQLNRTLRLLEGGVAAGQLHAQYLVLAARDVQSTASPGELLYAALRHLPNFSADPQRFFNRTCDDIYAELRAEDPPRR